MACRRGCAIAALVMAAACGPTVAPDTEDDTGSEVTGSFVGDADDSASATMTSVPTTTATSATATDPSTSISATASASATMTDPSATDPTTATVTITDPSFTASDTDPTGGDLPNGSTCEFDEECESGSCYVVQLLGGLCGECKVDGDCPGGGCTMPNPFAQPPVGASCNDGSYGGGCMSDDACADALQCATVIDVPGIVAVSTCSECIVDADCDVGSLCAPDIAVVGTLNGVNRCVLEGSLSDGQSCDYTTSGDASCASGHCAVADVMGLLLLGVCSECEADEDCGGLSCDPPIVDPETGFTPGTCAP